MSDLDDLEEIAGLPETSGRSRRQRYRHRSELDTHCKRGHALTPDNLHVSQSKKGIQRICKKCQRLRILCRED